MAQHIQTLGNSGTRMATAKDITFLMVGCQRCGSTWVDKALRGHPEIHLPPQKQTYFFDSNFDQGMDWYLEQYGPLKPGAKAVGEIATSYCLTDVLPRVANELPDIKIIMSVRNPVDRAMSFYKSRKNKYGWSSLKEAIDDDPAVMDQARYVQKRTDRHNKLRGNELGWSTLEEALSDNPRIIERGRYKEQIETILEHFPADRFLLLFYDDLVADDRAYLKTIFDFLGVDPGWDSPALGQRIQVSAFGRTRKLLRRLGAGQLIDFVSTSRAGDMLRRHFARQRKNKVDVHSTEADQLTQCYPFDLQDLREYCND